MAQNKKKCFVSDNARLASEWNWEKNRQLGFEPQTITFGSSIKVWWLCQSGHEWQASPNHRSRGSGCPECAEAKRVITRRKNIVARRGSLAINNPALALQWHPTKNGKLTPDDFTSQSNKKVWWVCERGHEWKATISDRSRGRGCPICFSEAKTSFPEQAIFYYLSQATTALSRYLLARRTEIDVFLPDLKIGIEYDGIYFHSGKKSAEREKRKDKQLDKTGITLFRVKESKNNENGLICENTVYIKPGSNDAELALAIRSICACISSHSTLALDLDIDIARDRSSIYSQYIEREKCNSLAVSNPKLAYEWHPTKNGRLLPEHVSAFSNKKVWWLCENKHEWQAVINSRSSGVGCPYCAGKRPIVGVSDLATSNPTLASQWHTSKNDKLTPQSVTANSNKSVWWLCEKEHEWKAKICDRNKGNGCPVCSGHKVLAGYNDLATRMPELATEWHPTKNGFLTPRDVTTGTDRKVWWICERGHEWEAAVSSRKFGYKCPYCAGQRVIPGLNDLATLNPALAAEWHPIKNEAITPREVMPGSNRKVWWMGKCNHEWEASICSRNSGRGCPYCASQKLLVGFNDLETLNPTLASEWHPTKNDGLSPRDVMPGSNRKVWWICERGHEWNISINVRNRGNGCPYCANQIVLRGYNDLATLNPNLAKQWHPVLNGDAKPSDFMPGSNKKAWWLCDNGHEWEAIISSRNKGAGCMLCYRESRKKH